MSRPATSAWRVLLLSALLIPACGDGPAAATSTTVASPATSSVPTTITTTTLPQLEPAEVSSVALLPDDTALQDGTWAVVIFRQSVDCIPEEADLVGAEPVECETPVLFEDEAPGALVGKEVPVWLVRWPVFSYALKNGLTTLGEIRRLPTLIEATTTAYSEVEGDISLSGSIPDMSDFRVEATENTTEFHVPIEPGAQPGLSELTGDWETGSHLVRIEEGGSYQVFELGPDGSTTATDLVGYVALQEGLLVFPSAAGPPCSGEAGVYFGYMIGPGLRLGAVDDPCEFRAAAFDTKWTPAG